MNYVKVYTKTYRDNSARYIELQRWTFVITNSKPYKNSPCILSLNMHGLFVTLDFVCDERVFIFWIDINAL